jgi:hypothetical protein
MPAAEFSTVSVADTLSVRSYITGLGAELILIDSIS